VVEGLAPICVGACPLRALQFDEYTTMTSTYTDNGAIAPMPESNTVPSLLIKACPAAKPVGDTVGHIANPEEVATL